MISLPEINAPGGRGAERPRPGVVAGDHNLVKSEDFGRLASYWRDLQAASDAAIPLRRQFNPADIVRLLPHIYLLERKSADNIQVRISGTALDELSGFSVTGHNYLKVCPREDRQMYANLTHHVLSVPCGAILVRDVTFLNERTYGLTSHGYPLADDNGIPRYTVGLMLPNRIMSASEMNNGAVLSSRFRTLKFMDLGFGVPEGLSGKEQSGEAKPAGSDTD